MQQLKAVTTDKFLGMFVQPYSKILLSWLSWPDIVHGLSSPKYCCGMQRLALLAHPSTAFVARPLQLSFGLICGLLLCHVAYSCQGASRSQCP